jgi:hypothetical protein
MMDERPERRQLRGLGLGFITVCTLIGEILISDNQITNTRSDWF